MHKNLTRRFANSKGLVLATYKSADYKGSNVIKLLQNLDNEMSFYGVGGDKMKSTGRFVNYADTNTVEDKPFFPQNNGRVDFRFLLFPPMLKNNLDWFKLNKQLKNNGFYEQFEKGNSDTDIMVSIGNPLFSARLFTQINNMYNERGLLKPFTIHIDKTSRKFEFTHHEFLDYFFYTAPLKPMNPVGFKFPGRFIGKQVIFDIYSYLYKHTDKYEKLAQQNAIYLHPELNTFIMEEVIFNLRNEYRTKNGIPDSATVFYISLGNTNEEIISNGKPVSQALKELLEKRASIKTSNDDFYAILNLPERKPEYEHIIHAFTNSGMNIKVTYGTAERYEAIAASDLGACANGDAVLECAAMQLPTQILDHSGFFKSYVSLLYNVYENDLNMLANGEVLPELTGRNFSGKIVEFWSNWLESPKYRYKTAIKTNKLLINLLPKPSVSENGNSIVVGSDVFTMYSNPQLELELGLRKALSDYRELKSSGLRVEEFANKRNLKLGLGFD